MKKRLFDFSPAAAVMTVAAYSLLTGLFGYIFFSSGYKIFYGIVFGLLILSFLFVFTYFVIFSPHLEKDGVHHGAKFIPKKDLLCKTAYDERFKEGAIFLRFASVNYRALSDKEKKKKLIRVQATAANLKKVGDYIGKPLEKPKKPPRRSFYGPFRKKNRGNADVRTSSEEKVKDDEENRNE